MRKYKNYTNEEIIEYSKEVYSIAGLLKKLGLKPIGGNYLNIKKHLQRLNIDTSHWTGKAWNKGKQLKNIKDYTRSKYVKISLIKIRGNKCESCKLDSWLDLPIMLELHHIDGKSNNEENLVLLCPNCHSLTENFRKPKF